MRFLAQHPGHFDAFLLQGMVLTRLGRRKDAARIFTGILQRHPACAEACYHLGRLCLQSHDYAGAAGLLHKAVQIDPVFAEAWYMLGNALYNRLCLEEAAQAYLRALQAQPSFDNPRCYLTPVPEKLRRTYQTHFYSNLGRVQRKLGQLEAARASYEAALRIDPDNALAHSRLLFLLSFHVLCEPAELLAAHRAWDARHGAQGRAHAFVHESGRTPARAGQRLRIGYLSPDFHQHAVSYFIAPLLAHHDPDQVEVFCYADNAVTDAVSHRLREQVNHWRTIQGESDAAVARCIHDDRIHILIDLAGHTTTRLKVFTYRPAPIQATYLGYFATTGLDAMDYWITDAVLHPADTVEQASEALWRLPRCCLAYQPAPEAPPVTARPAEKPVDGGIVFGSFNQITKISDEAVALWSKVLQAVPGSRLLLKCQMLQDTAIRRRLLARFEAAGLPASRLELHTFTPAYRDHLDLYNRVDILLDTIPRTGGSTTADALWMGVPVITLAGHLFVQRLSATMLHALNLEELIATTPEEYIEKAVALAQDQRRLYRLKAGLRQRMKDSPLCDGQGLARAMEAAYHNMWQRHLAARKAE